MASIENVVQDTEHVLERDYVDTFSIKDFLANDVMPKFFPDMSVSNLTTGTVGMVADYLATIVEDTFNAASSLLSETFPTRSKMPTSIYSNAAIFQLTDMIGDASRCDFLLLVAEEDIRKNLQSKPGSEYGYFYIDKDMIITIENGLAFTLDYDIEIRAVYRETRGKWVYSAKYMVEEYRNSISEVNDPYIRMQQYPNGMLVMKLSLRQYTRSVIEEPIVDNVTLNYPTIYCNYTDTLLGFDVLYKEPGETGFYTQLETRVIYSVPSKSPFCYYRMVDERSFELSFTTKDSYFQPKFNSELQIIIYTTKGVEGNFEYYDGKEFNIIKGDKYNYPNSWLVATRSISGAKGGKARMTVDGLKDLTIEGFTTALSLTTENDLQTYFNNYKRRYNNEMHFIKKRNDAVELLFSGFMYIKKDDYIFPTNTLYLDTNIQYLEYKDGGFYNLDPGYLFGYKGTDAYFIPYYYVINGGDGEKYDPNGHYYDADGAPVPEKDITLRELNKKILGGFVTETDRSYWKLLGDDSPRYRLFLSDGTLVPDTEVTPLTQQELLEKFRDGEVTYNHINSGINAVDFIMDFEKEAATKKAYIAFFENFKADKERPDMTFDEYLFEYTYKDYKHDRKIDNRRSIFNTNVEEFAKTKDFLFVNPFITTIAKDTGLVSYYQSFVSKDTVLDYVAENSGQTFDQFITYTIQVARDLTVEKQYVITIRVAPSSPAEDYRDYVQVLYDETNPELFTHPTDGELQPSLTNFDKTKLSENRLRMILTFTYKDLDVGYMELIPTVVDLYKDQIEFKGIFHTDDFISAANTLRITHICPYCGHEVLNSANAAIEGLNYKCDHCDKFFKEGIINIREMDTLELPLIDGIIRLTSLFKDPQHDEEITDNPFVEYDPSYNGYQWTNIYNTINDRICLMEPLQMMRSSIVYKDYYVTGVDALDCEISDLPLLKYSIMAYAKEGPKLDNPLISEDIGKFSYFMNAFFDNYDVLKEAQILLNGMGIDVKFYNSYGRSTNFDIGENGRKIDTNNIAIYFDVFVVLGTDTIAADQELKTYIKNYIETINDEGSNNLYISNLIREIENNFSYVHHLRFKHINSYDSNYQAIINRKIKLEDMTKQERRRFVPDILVINRNNIYLSFYTDEA